LSFIGALCVIFGLGMATYQVIMPEAGTNTTTNMTYENPADREGQALRRATPGLIVLGVGSVLLLAGAWFERRSG